MDRGDLAALLFHAFSNRRIHARGGALPEGIIDRVHILELNCESYRLKQSKARRWRAAQTADEAAAVELETGEITP
jgi:hypothetical protein